jgi:hypothetical protein
MNELRRLRASGRHLVTEELARGTVGRYDEEALATHLAPAERQISLDGFDRALTATLDRFRRGDPRMDPELAEAVHRNLPLSRREAADPSVWRYLAVVRHPEAVRHRWEYRSFATMRSRFWQRGTRFDANAFSRWWWVAELTCEEGAPYELTRLALSNGALSTHLFTRQLAWHRPTLAACVRVLRDASGPEVKRTMRTFGKMLSLRVPEAMSGEALEALVREAAGS